MPESDGLSAQSMRPGAPGCSEWARSQHLDPVGSAGYYDGFLLVEQPLPWPFDVGSQPELVEVAKVAASARLRLQAVIRVGGTEGSEDEIESSELSESPDGTGRRRRIICYRSARTGWAGPLVRSERLVANVGALAEAATELIGAELVDADLAGTTPAPLQQVDLLVCTHGRRDTCCGARGMELVNELRRQEPFSSPVGLRLWRTSHTGGHRFAPTAVLLPTATMWAWADPELLYAAASAEGTAGEWLERYRGCATVGTPAQQAVERAVLAQVGWPFLRSFRRASDVGDGVVQLEAEPGGVWEAEVREGRRVPQPDCRTSPELATKQGVEWVVEGLRQVVLS
jgi:hypothetical protein